jgi:hypothetical protein
MILIWLSTKLNKSVSNMENYPKIGVRHSCVYCKTHKFQCEFDIAYNIVPNMCNGCCSLYLFRALQVLFGKLDTPPIEYL